MAALTAVSDDVLLTKVKKALGVSGTYHDDTLSMHIADVKFVLEDAGIDEKAINGEAAVGVIVRGVADLWNIGSGTVNLSAYFKERVIGLALSYPKSSEESADV